MEANVRPRPLPSTLVAFWRCLWETKSACIIMATGKLAMSRPLPRHVRRLTMAVVLGLVEKGKRKCERYW